MAVTVTGVAVGLAVLTLVVASFFVRRHGEAGRPEPGWTPTDEVFNDPSTGRMMRVWLDEGGQRRYVAEGRRSAT